MSKKASKFEISDLEMPDDFEDLHDPSQFEKFIELEVGESIVGKFFGVFDYFYKDKKNYKMDIWDPKTKKVRPLPVTAKLKYLAAACKPKETWIKITRGEDIAIKGSKNPMKNYVYQTSGPKHTDAEIAEIFEMNDWNKKRESKKK